MDDGYSSVSILILILFVFLEAAFYGFGAAIQAVNQGKLEEDARNGSRNAARLLTIVQNPGRFVHTVQVTTHLVGMITGAVILPAQVGRITRGVFGARQELTAALIRWERLGLMILVAVLLLMVMISFGIIIPKRLAGEEPEKWCYSMLPVVSLTVAVFLPLTWLITLVSAVVLRLFGVDLTRKDDSVTEEDIMSMVNEGHEQGVLEADETEMITNIFELGDKEAGDIMTHRTSVTAFDGSMSLKEVAEFILHQGSNSRYPVYEEDIDHIIGILHLRDTMACYGKGDKNDWQIRDIPGLLRKANFIPETRKIDTLFKEMQSRKIHLEIVVDEYGQTAGLLTMEDILEEIVGNIMDEYDEEEEYISEASDGSLIMSGLTPLDDVMERLNIGFSDEDYDTYDTLNGFLVSRLERIPQEGEEACVDFAGFRFQVLKAGSKVIDTVQVTPLPSEENEKKQENENNGGDHRQHEGDA